MLLPVDRRLRAAVDHANHVPFFFFFFWHFRRRAFVHILRDLCLLKSTCSESRLRAFQADAHVLGVFFAFVEAVIFQCLLIRAECFLVELKRVCGLSTAEVVSVPGHPV